MRKLPPRALLFGLAALLLIGWQLYDASRSDVLFGDFRAFYCAAHAFAAGANPYDAAPLYRCESIPFPYGLLHSRSDVAIPAPLPGYALLAFVPFAVLPFVAACAVWLCVLLLCVALSARALSVLLGRPADLMLWTFVTAVTTVSIPTGEIGAPLLAALLWMAVALRRAAWGAAAAAGALAMVVPHVGLAAMLAVFVLVRRTRAWIAAAAGVLIAADIACGGVPTAVSYFTRVLPAHALAEIGSSMQYGMTWVLHALHFSDASAVAGGEISYVLMLLLGIWAAHAYVRRTGDFAAAVLIPPAFVVLGGTFIHLAQITVAIPAALLLFQNASSRIRNVFAAALLLLACPWLAIFGKPLLILMYAGVCGMLCVLVLNCKPIAAMRAAFGAAMICGAIMISAAHFGAAYAPHVSANHAGALAQVSWGQFVGTHWSSTGTAWWIAKAPTWIGLLLLALGCMYAVVNEHFETPVLVEEMPVTP